MKTTILALLCALAPGWAAMAQTAPAAQAAPATPASASASAQSMDLGDKPPAGFDSGTIVGPRVFRPAGQPAEVVFLITDKDGWTPAYRDAAQALVAKNIAVIGLDLPTYLQGLEKHPDDDNCAYAISDIEELSKRLQAGGTGDYRTPLIAGIGEGAGIAYAFASQIPASTISGIVAIDPTKGIVLKAPLCTDAKYETEGDRTVYGFTDGDMNVPVTAVFTKSAMPGAQDYVAGMAKDFPEVTLKTSDADQMAALSTALDSQIAALKKAEGPMNLPLSEMGVPKPALDTLAIIYSGDGGWRDIDRSIGQALQKENIPVVGVDSLRYFWNERKPQETADDLAKIITHYQKAWKVKHVLLIGYSFGADILPNSYNLLPPELKDSVAQVSLLGLTNERDYVIHVDGWLGMSSGSKDSPVTDIEKMPAKIVQCLYGDGDDDDACHKLDTSKYEVMKLDGGHHFDGNYDLLTAKIVAALKKRLGH